MATTTALIVLAKNGLTITDFSAINTEYIIDDCVDTINSDAQISISYMAGEAGEKILTLTGDQNAAFVPLITMRMREAKKTSLINSSSTSGSGNSSNSISAGGLSLSQSGSVSTAISSAASINSESNTIEHKRYDAAIRKLKLTALGPPIYLSNDPVPTS